MHEHGRASVNEPAAALSELDEVEPWWPVA